MTGNSGSKRKHVSKLLSHPVAIDIKVSIS